MTSLAGKVVIVTGGAGLLGQAFVTAIAQNGGTAVIADIDAGRGAEVAAQLCVKTGTQRVTFAKVDITDRASIEELINSVASQHGRIDAVVNNAYPRNKNYGRKFEDVEYADFCQNMNMHLGGYFLVSQAFAKHFCAVGEGNIVTVSSIYGVIAPRFDIYEGTVMTMPVEYAVIKSALLHLSQYMMRYFKGSGIRFNCVSPGGIFDHQPEAFLKAYKTYAQNKGMLDPADLTGALVFLLSDDSKYINGQNLIVDDGWSV
jgi:NAD(P)-dependent dehydrogenase (short-subunit alcohol dehydrogenase family)